MSANANVHLRAHDRGRAHGRGVRDRAVMSPLPSLSLA